MRGITLRGHQPTADFHIPPECRDTIRRGALMAVNASGGKDSQAMTILLAGIVLRDQLPVVHAPLGEVEWPGTIEHIQHTIPAGVPPIPRPWRPASRFSNASSNGDGFPDRNSGIARVPPIVNSL